MSKKVLAILIFATLALGACGGGAAQTIKIGINAPITGDIPKVGEGTKYSAEMWLEDIGNEITVGGKTYPVELVIEDNESSGRSPRSRPFRPVASPMT
jgi:branched-chain amino acid transport system substrate-binding protein